MPDFDDDIDNDYSDPYCDCGVCEHTEEEEAANRCGCCGKPLET